MPARTQRFALFVFGLMIGGCNSLDPNSQETGKDASRPEASGELLGEWKSSKTEWYHPQFKEFAACSFIVFEDKPLYSSPEPLIAELVVNHDGETRLASDTQPVFASCDKLYFGPVGSRYTFSYQISGEELRMELLSDDKQMLKLTFVRVSKNPGKPKFPEVSMRWFRSQ